jgi:DNA-directed RNA polymerase specialized sigma24 family protein
MESESFAHVWRAYQAGDSEAKSRVLADFIPRIAGLVTKYLRNRRHQEDVEQSVLLSIVAKKDKAIAAIANPDELWELFAAITLRHCSKHNKRAYRSNRRGPVVPIGAANGDSGSLAGYMPVDPGLSPDTEAAIADLIAECNKRLTDRQQNVLGQHLADTDRKEIARLLNIAISTVDRELRKIRTVLAKLAGESAK